MRKISALLVTTALAAAALVGCAPAAGTASSLGCTPSATPGPATSLVTVQGDLGAVTGVKTPSFLNIKKVERRVEIQGTGRQIVADDQVLRMTVTYVSSATGGGKRSNITDQQLSIARSLSGASEIGPAATEALQCARAGDRVVIAVPADKVNPTLINEAGSTDTTGVLAVVDIAEVFPSQASGNLVFNSAPGLPAVVRAPNGQPGVVVPSGAAPTQPVTETLIAGDGAKVDDSKQQAVIVQYVAVGWASRELKKSTWNDGLPFAGAVASLPDGLGDAINGKPVGSQIMLVVPDATSQDGKAVVYVADILGVLK